jgi:quaternary ammonium compound-resistance protein SugE
MNSLYLILAGLCEIGWPLGLKLSQTSQNKLIWIVVAALSMGLSGVFLWLAQKTIPMGTAYAVWTGIGAAGAFITGILIFKDPISFIRILSIVLIIAGVVGLKLSH